MTIVREFSPCGPCLTLGELIKRTPKGVTFRDRDGRVTSRRGYAVISGLVHVEPCRACQDHPDTSCPNGYMD